jgi:hypothetical protein
MAMRMAAGGMLLWLAAGLAAAPAPKTGEGARTRYFVVFMEGQKVGYVQEYRRVRSDGVYASSTMKMSLARAGMPMQVKVRESTLESHDGRPIRAKTVEELGAIARTTDITFGPAGKAKAVVTEGGRQRTLTLEVPSDALLGEGLLRLMRHKGLEPGTRYECTLFEATLRTALPAVIEVGPAREVDLPGRKAMLTEVRMSVPGMDSTSYVDSQAQALKMITSVAGLNIEIVEAPREVALSEHPPAEILDRMILSSPRRLEKAAAARSARFVLRPRAGAALHLPDTDFQDVRVQPDGRVVVTVRSAEFSAGAKFPESGMKVEDPGALEPNVYVQSDHPRIREIAQAQTQGLRTTREVCQRLERFVSDSITKKDLSVGYASAVEALDSRQGDCTEHAVLLAALCRSLGIPAKVVTGLMYTDDEQGALGASAGAGVFAPHAWVCVWSGGRWVPLDAAMGYDVTHLALGVGSGDLGDYADSIRNLGQFELEDVRLEP